MGCGGKRGTGAVELAVAVALSLSYFSRVFTAEFMSRLVHSI